MKRIGRRNVCWRKVVSGWTSYNCTDQRSGMKVQRLQSYRSSAVELLLMHVAAREDEWHSEKSFSTPEKLRLQQQLRTRRLKCEMQEPLGERPSVVSLIAGKVAAAEAKAAASSDAQ
uniref:Uncharacterized protein n=1 Tax=Chrysotila carterae TaxID=13221 RepID=A0A6T0BS26_CHRCT